MWRTGHAIRGDDHAVAEKEDGDEEAGEVEEDIIHGLHSS